jgi:hypothetical protein
MKTRNGNKILNLAWLILLTIITWLTEDFGAARPYAAASLVVMAMMED